MWAWGIPRYAVHAARVYNDGIEDSKRRLTRAKFDNALGYLSEATVFYRIPLAFLGIFALLFIFYSNFQDVMVETVVLTHAPVESGACCLDGTPPVYHISRGNNPRKWMIFHEGGDWCSQLMVVDNPIERDSWSCYTRAAQPLGSSKFHTSGFSFSKYASRFGYFSRDPQANPLMHDWNHVVLPYCDGASFSGWREQPAIVEDRELYFRGSSLLQAIMQDLLFNKGLAQASEIVLVGASAGGLAVVLQADTWAHTIRQASQTFGRVDHPYVVALVDGGFFPDIQVYQKPCNYQQRMIKTWENHNVTSLTFQTCVKFHGTKPWKCMFASNLAKHVKTPMFALVSAYDGWQLEYELCESSLRGINEYGDKVRVDSLGSVLTNPSNGIFLDACRHHTKCWNNIKIDGDSPASAFSKWYFRWTSSIHDGGPKRIWIQNELYGNNRCEYFSYPGSCEIGRIFKKIL